MPVAVAAYNATEHATTKRTPNLLMFNREVRHNFDKMLPESVDPEQLETWDDYVQRMDRQSREAFRVAREEIGRSVLLQKKYYDRTSHLNKYKVGDAVLIRDHRHHEAGTKKLADKYDGPYYVIDVLSDVSFRLSKSPEHEPKVIHHDRMKLYNQREKPDLKWVFRQSRTYNRQKSRDGATGQEAMAEVLDRVIQLENQIKNTAGRTTRQRKQAKIRKAKKAAEPKTDQPTVHPPKRKRGRPRKQQDPPKPETQPQQVEGVRRSERLKAKK